ncbi:MAG: sigma factor-like helix-turn-helix DNA-binding protein [Christensenellales bacterium]|jgi:hypothetical protein
MDLKRRMHCINRLLADVYGVDIRISSLLSDYLNPEQLECIKTQKLSDFLSFMLFGIRCRFVTAANGMRLYTILSARYGLEDSTIQTLAQIGDAEDVSRERIRQLEGKALQQLKPRRTSDPLKQLACLAAREVLGIAELPEQPSPQNSLRALGTATREQTRNGDTLSGKSTTDEMHRNSKAPPRHGAPWTPEQERHLVQRFSQGTAQSELAQEMGRSIGAIRARLSLHGLIDDEKETTNE